MRKSSRSLSSAFSLLCPKITSLSQHSTSNSYVKVEVETDETTETGYVIYAIIIFILLFSLCLLPPFQSEYWAFSVVA